MIACRRKVTGVAFQWEPGDIADGFHQFEYEAGRWRHCGPDGKWSEWQLVELEAGPSEDDSAEPTLRSV